MPFIMSLSDLSVLQLSDLLSSLSFNKLKTILLENEISGTRLNQITSVSELQAIDSRIKLIEAKGWYVEICKWKESLPVFKKSTLNLECPVCMRLFSEVDPTTLLCGHSLCVDDAKALSQCPTCNEAIPSDFLRSVNFALKGLSTQNVLESKSRSETSAGKGLNVDIKKADDTCHATEDSSSALSPVKNESTKKKSKNNKKKGSSCGVESSPIDAWVSSFVQANYHRSHEAFLQLESQAKTNHYVMGFLELYYRDNTCCNVSYEWCDVQKSFDILQDLAETSKDKYAMFIVARMHLCEEPDVTQIELRSLKPNDIFTCFKKCVDLGLTVALSELADCYAKGFGVQRNVTRAVELHQQAISMGHTYSYLGLARLSALSGNTDETTRHYTSACESKLPMAEYFWGLQQMNNNQSSSSSNGQSLLKHAAETGVVPALMHIARTETDPTLQIEWYKKAARCGCYQAIELVLQHYPYHENGGSVSDESVGFYTLGARVQIPLGVACMAKVMQSSGQYKEAFSLLKSVVDKKDHQGILHFGVGECFHHGRGVQKNLSEASKYYEIAGLRGSADAKVRSRQLSGYTTQNGTELLFNECFKMNSDDDRAMAMGAVASRLESIERLSKATNKSVSSVVIRDS